MCPVPTPINKCYPTLTEFILTSSMTFKSRAISSTSLVPLLFTTLAWEKLCECRRHNKKKKESKLFCDVTNHMILHTTCNNFSIHQHRHADDERKISFIRFTLAVTSSNPFFIRLARESSKRVCTRVPIFSSQNFHLLNFDALRDGIANIPQLLADLFRQLLDPAKENTWTQLGTTKSRLPTSENRLCRDFGRQKSWRRDSAAKRLKSTVLSSFSTFSVLYLTLLT